MFRLGLDIGTARVLKQGACMWGWVGGAVTDLRWSLILRTKACAVEIGKGCKCEQTNSFFNQRTQSQTRLLSVPVHVQVACDTSKRYWVLIAIQHMQSKHVVRKRRYNLEHKQTQNKCILSSRADKMPPKRSVDKAILYMPRILASKASECNHILMITTSVFVDHMAHTADHAQQEPYQ